MALYHHHRVWLHCWPGLGRPELSLALSGFGLVALALPMTRGVYPPVGNNAYTSTSVRFHWGQGKVVSSRIRVYVAL